VRAEAPHAREGKFLRRASRFYGEAVLFGISTKAPARDHVLKLLASHGLDLAEYEPVGEELAPKIPFGGLALAIVR